VVALCLAAAPAAAEDTAGLTITPAALDTLADGDLSVAPAGAADEVAPASFAMPVTDVTFRRGGSVKSIRLAGGVTIAGEDSLDLTKFRVNLPAQQASVRASSPGTRIPAFDVVRVKVSKKRVSGVLLIAPGTASVLNAQFDTYVFSDGLRFARFVYPL
jgi:hypothetical protein